MLLALPIAILALGIALLAVGLHGRRISAHPACRTCRYDLRLLTNPDHCPECGANLLARSAIDSESRRRRPRLVVCGGTLLALSCFSFYLTAYAQRHGITWVTIKPVSWLIDDAHSMNAARTATALTELNRRLESGDISTEQCTLIMDAMLMIQADRQRLWTPECQTLCAWLTANNRWTASRLERFYQQLGDIRVVTREPLSAGYGLPLELRLDDVRMDTNAKFWVSARLTSVKLDGEELVHNEFGHAQQVWDGQWINDRSDTLRFQSYRWGYFVDAPPIPGKHTVQAHWRFSLFDPMVNRRIHEIRESEAQRAEAGEEVTPQLIDSGVISWDHYWNSEIELCEEDIEPVEYVIDPSLGQAINESMVNVYVEIQRSSGQPTCFVGVTFESPPIDVAFDVMLDDGRGEWPGGHVVAIAKTSRSHVVAHSIPFNTNLSEVNIRFRTCFDACNMSASLKKVWYGEIRRPSVPVKRLGS